MKNVKQAAVRRQTLPELAFSRGGALDPLPVLRVLVQGFKIRDLCIQGVFTCVSSRRRDVRDRSGGPNDSL
jgi:hypothetical protein